MDRLGVLVAASGAAWESRALEQLSAGAPGIVLVKRCVDLDDLLASGSTGQAQVALVGLELPGLDAACTDLLRRTGMGVVLVAGAAQLANGGSDRARRLGLERVVEAGDLSTLNDVILAAGGLGTDPGEVSATLPRDAAFRPLATERGRSLAVWGPAGAPGRTTVAVGLAAELAGRGHEPLLIDVDPYGGAVAQHLGVLDDVSGLLAAARLANAGRLDEPSLASAVRQVDTGLRVLTGLPKADRWTEVREAPFEDLLELASTTASHLVLDTGFSLEQEAHVSFASLAPRRNAMTLVCLARADEVVVVGSADPVGLARLARGLVELSESVPGCTLRIVVNRARPALGWGEQDVRGMIEGFVTPASVHFLPDDRSAADRALVSGKSLAELGESPLRRGLQELATAVAGDAATPSRGRFFRRRGAARVR